ncbi:MAG: type II CRISPR-associated endonuclease Cas1 [Aestuariivirga sp.]|uniref:type II CRISPR-associated endonuclease Cas1 n=1 Tax=Aestuariivirga sp. TaxID=2650926 RepID=UPI0038CFFCBF
MQRRTIEIGTPGSRLSVSYRQLVIERREYPRVTLPIDDLGVVIVDDRQASYTQAVLVELMNAGATIIVTGSDHLPIGMMLPLQGHHLQTERHIAQAGAALPLRKRIWQELVRAKISQQARILAHFEADDGRLSELVKMVKSGDSGNHEAQAAQRYWPLLFGTGFRRDREADGVNAFLNYGYAVIRAAVARAVAAAGLIPSLGVFHTRRSNPFCLADDLLEPFRPFVDWRVRMIRDSGCLAEGLSSKQNRAALLSLFNEGVMIGARQLPLLGAIEASAASLSRSFAESRVDLQLPRGLPLGQSSYGEESEPG